MVLCAHKTNYMYGTQYPHLHSTCCRRMWAEAKAMSLRGMAALYCMLCILVLYVSAKRIADMAITLHVIGTKKISSGTGRAMYMIKDRHALHVFGGEFMYVCSNYLPLRNHGAKLHVYH